MRIKKRKRQNRAVKFYSACCDFRKPFRVFCCGTFVHHLIDHRITPADHFLAELLGSPVKLFTSSCIIAEVKRLGPSYNESLEAACSLITARCPHEELMGGEACILDFIGKTNAQHFFVATTDYGLRAKLRQVPNTPIIYASQNAVLLESPSVFQRDYVKKMEEERSNLSLSEYKILNKRAFKEENPDSEKEGTEDQQTITKKKVHKRLEMKDKVQFKRKRAKGPNPLSCLKKKQKPENTNTLPKESGDGNANSDKKKRNRKRKKSTSNKNKQASQTEN